MAGTQLHQRGGHNGAFEVQMQLGLGQAADEGFDVGHSSSLVLNGGGRVGLHATPPTLSCMEIPCFQ